MSNKKQKAYTLKQLNAQCEKFVEERLVAAVANPQAQ